MRGVTGLSRRWAAVVAFLLTGLLLSGCKTIDGGPDRIYSIPEEVTAARATIETLTAQYYGGGANENARNEIIARRMYIIDVEYSQYEEALTRERQELGFITATTAQGLNVAGALFTPAQTVRIMSGLAGGVGAVRGYYDSEVVIAKTIQIAQGQMRVLRDQQSDKIRKAMAQPLSQYPLSLALSDLEDYYRAGTLAAGLIKAVGDSGSGANSAAAVKQNIINVSFVADSATQDPITQYLLSTGAVGRQKLNQILRNPPLNSSRRILDLLPDGSPSAVALRAQLIAIARTTIPNFPK
jgi:hypothetical protein